MWGMGGGGGGASSMAKSAAGRWRPEEESMEANLYISHSEFVITRVRVTNEICCSESVYSQMNCSQMQFLDKFQ